MLQQQLQGGDAGAAGAQGALGAEQDTFYYQSSGYKALLLDFIRTTSARDGQWAAWNSLVFDHILPLKLKKLAGRWRQPDVARAMRKLLLPMQQAHDNKILFPNSVRVLLAPYARSRRQNALAERYSSVALTPDCGGSMSEHDEGQEACVKQVKEKMSPYADSNNADQARAPPPCSPPRRRARPR